MVDGGAMVDPWTCRFLRSGVMPYTISLRHHVFLWADMPREKWTWKTTRRGARCWRAFGARVYVHS